MSDKRDFDPRFDPAFQRGYVAGGGSAPQAPAPQSPIAQSSEPTRQWTNPPQVMDARARPEAPAPGSAPAPHPEPLPTPVALDGNPWVRVLWIIAPVFIIGGLIGQAWAQSRFMGGVSTSGADAFTSYVLPAVAQSICPWMILTGLAALVGVVFLHAVRWRAAE